ncbi:hypothetical protein RRG08_063842 [Elysia crispata]|uniref:Uncharacterized protein n=1 Tax=Elysia crispata TaxID=231223 RepID=A0AAE0Y692_9GAST|nr:hypothetical protein RRG08_063842 [Elysia crispata]
MVYSQNPPLEFMQHFMRHNLENQSNLMNNDNNNGHHNHHHGGGERGGENGNDTMKSEHDKDKESPNRRRMKMVEKDIKEEDQVRCLRTRSRSSSTANFSASLHSSRLPNTSKHELERSCLMRAANDQAHSVFSRQSHS